MKTNNHRRTQWASLLMLVVIAIWPVFQSCDDPDLQERTNFQELIGEYLENNSDDYSMLVELLYKAESMSFLKAYGGYTLLAPDNDAISAYLSDQGLSSLNDLSEEDLKTLVRYHVVKDTISTTEFVDGRLKTENMYGHFITSGTYFEDGEVVTKFNKYANLVEPDIRLANGIVHRIGAVVRPELESAAKALEADGGYDIFVEALKQTGWYDTLDVVEGPHTIFAVPDEVYAEEGFSTFEELLADVAPETENFTDTLNNLNRYVAYHILDNSIRYITDLIADRVGLTRTHNEVLTIRMDGEKVLVNDDVFAGIHEPGFEIARSVSDRTVLNGVVHDMKADFRIKERFPFAVYWDVAEQIEIMKMPGVFRRPGWVTLDNGQLEKVRWYGDNNTISYGAGLSGAEGWHVYDDRLDVNLRPEVIQWIEFDTPILVAGEYKMWVCTRNVYGDNNRKAIYYAYFNDEVLTNIINNRITLNNTTPEEEFEMEGFKLYGWNPDDIGITSIINAGEADADTLNVTELNYMHNSGASRMTGQLAGVINVETTGSHRVKFVGITGTNGAWFDMIHFIPVEENQLWPRVNTETGELVTKEEINAAYQEYLSGNAQ
ncbi:fasciclin domain-containing protein [Geofilum rhodophaeum]|uniref:fasciclin domain-containing protein n=1 Tax=Geofilum rhodophaeum TaxID=1965019 RepID=UPI000B526303|nr:fasciclin domain-containing protein [Geofilum rhodophaeum]